MWKSNVLSSDVAVLDRDWSKGYMAFESLLIVEQYKDRALWKPEFFVLESLRPLLDNKGERGRDYVWLHAWLTEAPVRVCCLSNCTCQAERVQGPAERRNGVSVLFRSC